MAWPGPATGNGHPVVHVIANICCSILLKYDKNATTLAQVAGVPTKMEQSGSTGRAARTTSAAATAAWHAT